MKYNKQPAESRIQGEVLSLHYYIEDSDNTDNLNSEDADTKTLDHAYKDIVGNKKKIHKDIDQIVKTTIGSEFSIKKLSIVRGSLIIDMVIISQVLTVIVNYKNFINSIELAKYQIEKYILKKTGNQTNIQSSWSPKKSLQELSSLQTESSKFFPYTGVLLWYVVISHAALLALVIFLVSSDKIMYLVDK